jgi:hypothetical protein
MRQKLIVVLLAVFAITGCTKPNATSSSSSLQGKWRMIYVVDNLSGPSMIKPAGINGDVDITFTPATTTSGSFKGFTPTNEIFENPYTTGANQSLSITSLNMTKVAETSWGDLFVQAITFAQQYDFTPDGKLNITAGHKTLVFMKL